MKYARLDNDKVISVHEDAGPLPSGAISLNDAQYNEILTTTGSSYWQVVNGAPTKVSVDQTDEEWNAAIDAQLIAADLKIIRALTEGDTARINAHKAAQAALRATRR